MEDDREKCLAAGMEDYLVKPVTLEQLTATLARVRRAPDRRLAGAAAPAPSGDGADPEAIDRGLLERLEWDLGGEAPLRALIATFLEEAPAALAELRDAAGKGNAEAIRRTEHRIKGTSATLGARRLAERCGELERLGRSGDLPAGALARSRPGTGDRGD